MEKLSADVVVVACGPAGLAAAISAAEAGLSVIALEKSKRTGGAANAGMGPLGLNTDVQRRQLSTVSVEKAFEMFMNYTHWRVDANLVKTYFEKSADTILWLEDMGVQFYQASRYFPGSEATWHIVMPDNGKPGPGAGRTMILRMTERAKALGVQFMMETAGQSLVMEDGKVAGVVAKTKDGKTVTIGCKAAVIATGGFGGDAQMVREQTGYVYNQDFFGFQIPGLVGDGIRMAKEAGAASTDIQMELTVMLPTRYLNDTVRAAFHQPNLLVNLQGERFFNEDLFENSTYAANAVNIQKGRCGVMVLDDAAKQLYVDRGVDVQSMVLNVSDLKGFDEGLEKGIAAGSQYVFKADTLEELAEKAGIQVDTFLKTVEQYNHYCDTYDAQFGKRHEYMKPIRKAPFYAGKFFPGAYGTLGGIKINYRTEVMTPDFDIIPGLYAAGTDTCTIYGDSYMFLLPGNSMGYCLNTGRMAGENIAAYLNAANA